MGTFRIIGRFFGLGL